MNNTFAAQLCCAQLCFKSHLKKYITNKRVKQVMLRL